MHITRDIEKEIENNLENDLILVLVGARQTGKTSILRRFYSSLKKNHECYFLNLEDPDHLHALNEHPLNLFKLSNSSPHKKQLFFIDEIQYLENPSNFLKFIYDEHKATAKLIVTGSSSFYIDRKFTDSLAGRKRIIRCNTLNFNEFLRFKNKEEIFKKPIYKRERELLFLEYINYGAYPRVVLEKDAFMKKQLLLELANDYIKKDVLEAGVKSDEKYFQLMKILASQVGNLINNNELASTLRLSVTAIENYLYVMQKSFHIQLIKPFFSNVRKELTKMPKAYFLDLGLKNHFLKNFENINDRSDKGSFLENIVFRELIFKNEDIKFWRTQNKNEVDFIVNEKKALEVKFSQKDCRESKYKLFKKEYPEINFQFITFDDLFDLI